MAFSTLLAQVIAPSPAARQALADSMRSYSRHHLSAAGIKETMAHPLAQPAVQVALNPIIVFLAVVAFLLWLFREPVALAWRRHQQLRAGAVVPLATEQPGELEALRAQSAYVLEVMRENDRLLLQRAVLLRVGVPDEKLAEWNKANWKALALHNLALLQLLRPLVYADYRDRIWLYSPTFSNQYQKA